MLRHLAIKDFAVVRAAELEFGEGMTVISGETGAGKSLLVDALGFLSGLRADSGVVRHGAERAELSAEFSAPSGSPAQAWLADNELDDEGQTYLLEWGFGSERNSCKEPVGMSYIEGLFDGKPMEGYVVRHEDGSMELLVVRHSKEDPRRVSLFDGNAEPNPHIRPIGKE